MFIRILLLPIAEQFLIFFCRLELYLESVYLQLKVHFNKQLTTDSEFCYKSVGLNCMVAKFDYSDLSC